MSLPRRFSLLLVVVVGLTACGEPATAPPAAAPAAPSAAAPASPATKTTVEILPAHPGSGDCLQVIFKGQPASSRISWQVNGQPVKASAAGKLCPEAFRRGDQVTVSVGGEAGGSANVVIGDSPPRITGISATPEQVFAGSDIQVLPVAEDQDDDAVEFRYQWLINGEADPFLTDSLLPGDRFRKGDVIQVRIVPFDGVAEGPVYESYPMTVPNAPPQILSQPPQQFEALEYLYQVKARDPDGDRLVYSLVNAPQGMSIDRASGLLVWPLTGVRAGSYPFRVIVRDPDDAEAFQEFTLTLGAPAPAAGGAKP